jgi:hypothetical protein
MNQVIEDFKYILSDHLHHCSETNSFILKELHPDSTTGDIKFSASSSDLLVVKLDNPSKDGTKLLPFFKSTKGKSNCHLRVTDYVIFYLKNKRLYIFICELKSDIIDGARLQLVSGQHITEYFLTVLKRCFSLDYKVTIKLLLFSNEPAYKCSIIKYKCGKQEYTIEHYLGDTNYELDSFI